MISGKKLTHAEKEYQAKVAKHLHEYDRRRRLLALILAEACKELNILTVEYCIKRGADLNFIYDNVVLLPLEKIFILAVKYPWHPKIERIDHIMCMLLNEGALIRNEYLLYFEIEYDTFMQDSEIPAQRKNLLKRIEAHVLDKVSLQCASDLWIRRINELPVGQSPIAFFKAKMAEGVEVPKQLTDVFTELELCEYKLG